MLGNFESSIRTQENLASSVDTVHLSSKYLFLYIGNSYKVYFSNMNMREIIKLIEGWKRRLDEREICHVCA